MQLSRHRRHLALQTAVGRGLEFVAHFVAAFAVERLNALG
jgi:hypothetical protein